MSILNRYTLLSADWDSETGISKVRINTDIGAFEGIAKLHPDDYPSRYIGCEIAEIRALVKFYKAQKREAQNKRKALQDFYLDCLNKRSLVDDYSFYMIKARKHIFQYILDIEQLETDIKFFEQKIKTISLSIPPKKNK